MSEQVVSPAAGLRQCSNSQCTVIGSTTSFTYTELASRAGSHGHQHMA